ncbi:MAG: NAD-glutamate dehydrogenase, partial [Actinomyces sp.]
MGTLEVDDRARATFERILAHAAEFARDRLDLDSFLAGYFAHVDPADLAAHTVEDLFGLAAAHRRLALDRRPDEDRVVAVNPRVDVEGWSNAHTVVFVVTEDRPFLVDSVIMELSRLGLGIHLVIHPVLVDRRDEGGAFVDLRGNDAPAPKRTSFIAVEVDRRTDPDELAAIETSLVRVLGDVRRAVDDWHPMRQRMLAIAAGLDPAALPVPDEEVDEARELLEWLAEDHFIFLGYREYRLDGDLLTADADTGLGILRPGPEPPPVRHLGDLPPRVVARIHQPVLLNLTKSTAVATVHRPTHMDYVGIKTFDADGRVTGERRFLGLFTSEVYTRSVTEIPRLRRLVREVVARADFPPGGHDEKRLVAICESYPRDELFQVTVDELYATAVAIAGLQERRRVRVFARAEIFGRFVTVMVYLPRDLYNTTSRTAISDLLLAAYDGAEIDWSTRITESVLARILFHIRVAGGDAPDVDVAELESRIEEILRDWDDDFAAELVHVDGEDTGGRLARIYARAFPPGYRGAFSPRAAVADLHRLEALDTDGDDIDLAVYREPGQPDEAFKLKVYRWGESVSLTSLMPTLTNLGVTVVDERTFELQPADRPPAWIYDFWLEQPRRIDDFATESARLDATVRSVRAGEVADDGFNRLVLAAGLDVHEVAVLRAYARYLRQCRVPYSPGYIESTLVAHPDAARLLVELFEARFDPDPDPRPDGARRAREREIEAALRTLVDRVSSLDEDRILRRFVNLVTATTRTNHFQTDAEGRPPSPLVLKLDPTRIEGLPEPRPHHEIFVYAPDVEGVHLRAGRVARGGLRWSTRPEDFRTEILGLLKAQMVKNAVIVPAGAKGGFVVQSLPDDRDSQRRAVEAAYRRFVSALLDVTDNLVDDEVVPPPRVVRHDGDDPYLVVAADKGTATFSDLANEIAQSRGMWLGDAFASGGSHGYDHKAMGITARGAWESVKRHFRELGRDVTREPVTVVGIGDMSGDVFGNGMLLSRSLRLIAAFDHRHVFVDPDPDPEASYRERARLFALPASSWADYDPALISPGGGVFPRSAKSLELSPEAATALGVEPGVFTPDELISAILRAPVDLLWNGGIGTYVKAHDESHAEVGDKANDAVRVDARDLRVRVVGEGGNLGFTQRGRVEFAARGGRINTDAIDNSGGVDCSDHEVNIKILLDRVVADGDLTVKQRNELLEAMTDEVAELVLADNARQTLALSAARIDAASLVDVHARYLAELESRGLLDRRLEFLPDGDTLAERRRAGSGLTTPELAVVMAYTKNVLVAELLESEVPDDPCFAPVLVDYFPRPIRERYPDRIARHRLRREIVANRIANLVVDRAGETMVYRLSHELAVPPRTIAAAHMVAWDIFALDDLLAEVDERSPDLDAGRHLAIVLGARQLAERATRLLLWTRPYPFDAAAALAELSEPVRALRDRLPEFVAGTDRAAYEARVGDLETAGLAEELVGRVAALPLALAALEIVEVATQTGVDPAFVAPVHYRIADRLGLDWLRDRIVELPRDTQWASLARLTLRADLYADQRALTTAIVASGGADDPRERVDRWMER